MFSHLCIIRKLFFISNISHHKGDKGNPKALEGSVLHSQHFQVYNVLNVTFELSVNLSRLISPTDFAS